MPLLTPEDAVVVRGMKWFYPLSALDDDGAVLDWTGRAVRVILSWPGVRGDPARRAVLSTGGGEILLAPDGKTVYWDLSEGWTADPANLPVTGTYEAVVEVDGRPLPDEGDPYWPVFVTDPRSGKA